MTAASVAIKQLHMQQLTTTQIGCTA
eukprot:COSAG01_NODE_7445_length_3208_cov_41.377613_6_plen_25_part_01